METINNRGDALAQDARMIENILQSAADGICLCHNISEAPYVRFSHWNPQMVAVTGYTMDEINRLGWYQTMYPDPEVQKRAVERMALMREGDDIRAEEWTITRKDGEKRCLSISTSIVTEEDGKVHVLAVMHDVTERKRAEEEVRSNQALLEGVLNGLRDAVGIQLPDYTVIRYNKAGYELLGLSPEQVIGRKCYELIGRVTPCDLCATKAAVQTKRIQTVERFVSELGRHFLCTSNPILRPDDEIEVIVEQLTDITELVKAEQALKESEEKYRFLAENMLDMVWIVGPDLRTRYVSPSIEKVLGFTPEERHQQCIEDAVTPESFQEIQRRLAEELQLDGEPGVDPDRSVVIETEYYRKDGSTVWMENRVQAVRDSENKITGMFGVSRDVTERRRAEAERLALEQSLMQAKKAESLSCMAGAIAHHFNNKLFGVIGNLELAMADLRQGAVPFSSLSAAMSAAHKAADVSKLMLTYLGQMQCERKKLDLSETCRMALPLLQAAMPNKVNLEADLPAPGPFVHANLHQIQEVLTNLVTNAWESMAEGGGTIHLKVKTTTTSDIPAANRFPIGWQPQDQSYACLEVKDTGPGIVAKDMERLFDPFFSTKFTGRGMGLPVILGIVSIHGGGITVETGRRRAKDESELKKTKDLFGSVPLQEKGMESVFRVFLPLSI